MILTAEQLKAISPATPLDRIKTFLPHLNEYLPKYGINTPIEVASFLAQVLHESGGLKWLREIWGPTPAQSRYEGRKDLGNVIAGDGKKFMGRGLIQVTGRTNYMLISRALFNDDRLLITPELLATPQYGTLSSCLYWRSRNLDAIDDDNSIREETKKVNGGYNGLKEREQYFETALKIFGVPHPQQNPTV